MTIQALNGGPAAASQWGEGSVSKSCVIAGHPLTFCKGGTIDETYCKDAGAGKSYRIREGTLFARLTTGGALVPCRCTKLSATSSSGTNTITVTSAHGFMAGDTIKLAGSVNVTISSIDYDTNVITLTANLGADRAVGDAVIGRGSLAGSEIAIGILVEDIDLWNAIKETRMDIMSNNNIAIVGHIDMNYVLGDLATARAYSGNKLTHLVFPHDH